MAKRRRELRGELLLPVGLEVPLRQLRAADHLAEPEEELRLERADREPAAVGGLVDPVAGEAAGEEARQRVAAEPVRDEPVGAVRHRDRQPRAAAGALALEQGGEHLDDGAERAGGEVGGLQRRQPGRRVLEHAGPAEVVEVVAGARRVRPVGAEAGDRAVDDRLGHVVRADAEAGGDSGTEALEHDVRALQQGARELRLGLQVAGDRLLAPVQRLVPRGRDVPHRVALGRLEPDDARAQSQQLAGGEGAREVAGQVDDEHGRRAVAPPANVPLQCAALTDRSTNGADKRRVILDAAVRVFAEKGYHTCRVGDIAEEAGIAHGLLYHYFASKEEVLETVFRENWRELLDAFDRIEASDEPPLAQLAGIAKVLLRAWRDRPDLVTVMVREVARSPQLQGQVDEIRAGFLVIQRVIERGQADGSFRPELDARLASWIFYGGLEELLTGWVLGQLPDGDEAVARAERTVIDLVCGGLTRAGVAAPA